MVIAPRVVSQDGVSPRDASRVITVAIIEDNRLVRSGLAALLKSRREVRVVVARARGDNDVIARAQPDVLLLDAGLRDADGLRLTAIVRREIPTAHIILMDLLPEADEISAYVSVGVSGFVMKDATLDELVETICRVAAGDNVLPSPMVGSLFSEIARELVIRGAPAMAEATRMTPREREVIRLIADGLGNKEIAARLHIATHTAKSHVRNIMEKLALHTRLQIAAYAHGESRS